MTTFRRTSGALVVTLALLMLMAPPVALAAAPTISSFNPTSGPIGTVVTITGTNLSGVTAVKFNGKSASFSNNTSTSVKATVPAGASTGKVSVTTGGGTGTSAAKFTVKLGILVSKSAAPPDGTVKVSGSAFTANGAVDVYFDTTHVAIVIADAKGTFAGASVGVPATALPGTHWISAVDRVRSTGAQKPLTVRTNWPQFHFGIQRRGRNTAENVISRDNVAGLEAAWIATPAPNFIESSPAVADGVVYVGSFDGKLYAYAVGCAANGGTCSPLWVGTPPGGDGASSMQLASPAVADGVVYIGSTNGRLYAFGVGCNSGGGACSPIWKGVTGLTITGSPAVADGVVYIGSIDHTLYAFAVGCATGGGTCTPIWTGTTGDGIFGSPAVANGVVYVGSNDDKVYAFAVGCNTGGGACTPIWTGSTTGNVNTPVVADRVVYAGSADFKLYAFGVGCNTGGGACTPIWTGTTGGGIESAPAVAEGVVYIGSADGKLYAFGVGCNAGGGTCTPIWTGTAGAVAESSPAVANGVVYVGSNAPAGGVFAFAVGCASGGGTCTRLWKATVGQVYSSPAVSDGVVYFGSVDRNLYAFDLAGSDSVAIVGRPDLSRLRPDPDLRPKR